MFEKLEAYLEEISHFLSGRGEREEILSEIKSHILLILYFISVGVVVDFIKSLVLSGRKKLAKP
jgi:hypothetical protein